MIISLTDDSACIGNRVRKKENVEQNWLFPHPSKLNLSKRDEVKAERKFYIWQSTDNLIS
jgi:hypothetical protein